MRPRCKNITVQCVGLTLVMFGLVDTNYFVTFGNASFVQYFLLMHSCIACILSATTLYICCERGLMNKTAPALKRPRDSYESFRVI